MMKGYGISESTAKNLMAAREDYLQATFAAIKNQYGSIDNYLEKEMGLDKKSRKKLKELYLNQATGNTASLSENIASDFNVHLRWTVILPQMTQMRTDTFLF